MTDLVQITNAGDYAQVAPSTNDEKLIDLWAGAARSGDSRHTSIQYRTQAKKFMDAVGLPLQAVRYDDLLRWQQGLTGAINSRRVAVNAVRSLFSFALETGYIRINPSKLLKPPRAQETKHAKVISEANILRLLDSDISPRNRAIVYVLYSTGCRVSELVGMNWEDVLPGEDGRAEIVIRGKGGKTRVSGISSGAYQALLAIKGSAVQESEPVFVSSWGKRIDRRTINYMLADLSTIIGQHITPHFFRHTHVTHSLRRGANPIDILAQVGHSSLSVTTGYAHSEKHSSDSLIV
jgi:site-specific recombinase XerD